MIGADVASAAAQFGVAGLIGWMWLCERRAAAARERQLTELHERLVRERSHLRLVVRTLRANTRALTALEAGQRDLRRWLYTRLGVHGTGLGAGMGAGAGVCAEPGEGRG